VQVVNKRDAYNSPEALKRQALEDLKEQKFNEMLEIWLKKIRKEAKVKILL
jgi:parvulin-like peptidyl-prolyl isomerase